MTQLNTTIPGLKCEVLVGTPDCSVHSIASRRLQNRCPSWLRNVSPIVFDFEGHTYRWFQDPDCLPANSDLVLLFVRVTPDRSTFTGIHARTGDSPHLVSPNVLGWRYLEDGEEASS